MEVAIKRFAHAATKPDRSSGASEAFFKSQKRQHMALSQRHVVTPDRFAGKPGASPGVLTVEEEEPPGRPHRGRARLASYQPINRQARVGATTSGIGSGGEL